MRQFFDTWSNVKSMIENVLTSEYSIEWIETCTLENSFFQSATFCERSRIEKYLYRHTIDQQVSTEQIPKLTLTNSISKCNLPPSEEYPSLDVYYEMHNLHISPVLRSAFKPAHPQRCTIKSERIYERDPGMLFRRERGRKERLTLWKS
jgi:hypothetical protein